MHVCIPYVYTHIHTHTHMPWIRVSERQQVVEQVMKTRTFTGYNTINILQNSIIYHLYT
jgi:hypothetical protein